MHHRVSHGLIPAIRQGKYWYVRLEDAAAYEPAKVGNPGRPRGRYLARGAV
jgi:hypothetical protein